MHRVEEELGALSGKKSALLAAIEAFNIRYYVEVGDIIKRILALKEERLKHKTEKKRKVFEESLE